ncbi:Transcription factor STP2 [Yarrowia sp. C11]|nr:Transcription factor STP2 [Yarrowia sp. C11]KAG5370625.1 Transcription factor STP2 [Yarrowia sp. E02]
METSVSRPTSSPHLFRLLRQGAMLVSMMATLLVSLFWPSGVSFENTKTPTDKKHVTAELESESDDEPEPASESDEEITTPTVSLFPSISNLQKLDDDSKSPKPCATDTYFGMLPMVNPQGDVVGWDVCDNTAVALQSSQMPFDLDMMYSMDSLSDFSSVPADSFFMGGSMNVPMGDAKVMRRGAAGPERKRSSVASSYNPYERRPSVKQQQIVAQQQQHQPLTQDLLFDLGDFPSADDLSPLSHSSYTESTLSSPKFQMPMGMQQQMTQQVSQQLPQQLPQQHMTQQQQLFYTESPQSEALDFETFDRVDRFSSSSSLESPQALDYLVQEQAPVLQQPALEQPQQQPQTLEQPTQPIDFYQISSQHQLQAPVVTLSPPASSRSSSPYSVSNSGSAGEEGDDVPKFVCPHCDSTFRIRGYLTRHLKKHSEKKAHTCPFYDCAAEMPCHPSGGFSRRDTYKTHLKARHFIYPPGTKSAQRSTTSGTCSGCGEMFESNETWIEEHIHKGVCKGLPDFDGVPGRVCAE